MEMTSYASSSPAPASARRRRRGHVKVDVTAAVTSLALLLGKLQQGSAEERAKFEKMTLGGVTYGERGTARKTLRY